MAPWRGPVSAAQPEADLPDEVVLGGVGQSVLAVHVADGGAGHVECGDGGAVGGSLDQVGGQRGGLGRQRRDPSAGAPAFPDAPRVRVHETGALGVRGFKRGGDAKRIVQGQTMREARG